MRDRPAVLSARSKAGLLSPEPGRSQEIPAELVRYAVAESDSLRLTARLMSCRTEWIQLSNTNRFTNRFVANYFMTKLSIFLVSLGTFRAPGKSQTESGTKTG